MTSSEDMREHIDLRSVKLMLCACTHLGGWDTWDDYIDLMTRVIVRNRTLIKEDGYLVVFQTDAMIEGRIMPRGFLLLDFLRSRGFQLLDYKTWKRMNANLRQPPNTHVFVMSDDASETKRPNPSNKPYFQGVWDYPATAQGKLNSWPDSLIRMMIETFTDEGDLVVDPFAGSCRILPVAAQLGRRAEAYEIDMDLVDMIEKNVSINNPLPRDLTGQLI